MEFKSKKDRRRAEGGRREAAGARCQVRVELKDFETERQLRQKTKVTRQKKIKKRGNMEKVLKVKSPGGAEGKELRAEGVVNRE